jgi:GNAT superfamily N-acetyltransferase
MAGGRVIRELREGDAAAVARLQLAVNPYQIVTPEAIWYRASRGIERELRREWVAEVGDRIVGSAQAGFEWSVPTPGKGRFWIGVHPDSRGRGIGGELYDAVVNYLSGAAAWRLKSWVDGDPAGGRFLTARGFAQAGGDRVSALDLGEADVREPMEVPNGFRLASLGEVRDRAHDLHAICVEGELDMPGEEPETEVDFDSWAREELNHPDISDEGSFVVLEAERPVALAFLSADPARGLGYNMMTATLRTHRRRGLALLAKLAVIHWSLENGLERLITENDDDNHGMLTLNRRLGYRPLYLQEHFVRKT